MKKKIPYGRQKIFKNDFSEIKKALNSEFITSGKYVEKFESSFCNYTKARYSISCCSGSAAIHLALEAINLKNNDIKIIRSINFISQREFDIRLAFLLVFCIPRKVSFD